LMRCHLRIRIHCSVTSSEPENNKKPHIGEAFLMQEIALQN